MISLKAHGEWIGQTLNNGQAAASATLGDSDLQRSECQFEKEEEEEEE